MSTPEEEAKEWSRRQTEANNAAAQRAAEAAKRAQEEGKKR